MKSLLIRAEDKNKWEKRAPIVPKDLKYIIDKTGVKAYVERSDKRFFTKKAYESAGAQICDNMDKGDVILGVKEIPEDKIVDDRIYIFFSHTVKGQASGMPLLKKIMASGSTLIDYEKIKDENNRRLIYFGRYAGDAGAIDILHLMGRYWKHHGIDTPFIHCRAAHQYSSVEDARQHIGKIGDNIRNNGFPDLLSPMVFGILGYGNVSGGAQHILNGLPVERIPPKDLKAFTKGCKFNANTVYLSVFKEEDLVVNNEGKTFELQEYYDHPEKFDSVFEKYLNCCTVLINAVYWEKRYPRFVTWDGLKRLYEGSPNPKLSGIADITCDTNGSIECNVKSTDSGMPSYICNPITREVTDGYKGDGILVLAVDNLPCELPNDSSTFFSGQLKAFVPNILASNYDVPLEQSGLMPAIQKAVIVYRGELTLSYRYLEDYL